MFRVIDARQNRRPMIGAKPRLYKSSMLITDLPTDCMLEITRLLGADDILNLGQSNSYMAQYVGEALARQSHIKHLLDDARIYVRVEDEYIYDAVRAIWIPQPNYTIDAFFKLYGVTINYLIST